MNPRSIDPRTGELFAEFPSSSPDMLREALVRARRAQKEWAARSKEERIAVIKSAEGLFSRRKEEIVSIIEREGGFPRRDIAGAYASAMCGFSYYPERYLHLQVETFPMDPKTWSDTTVEVEKVPHGVIGHIGVWNYPFWQTMITAIPALLVGNAIVFKPSKHVTLTAMRIGETWQDAGLPEDLFIVLPGGTDVGKLMVREDFDALVFTGGIEVGKEILCEAGVKPLILELSGNDASIVCADADLDQAARGVAQGSLSHGGQVCIRIKRVYVVKDILDGFLDRFLPLVRDLKVREQIGPLIREEAREKVQRQVEDLISRGAELLVGGHPCPGEGFYFEPTVLLIKDANKTRVDEEIFGPVCPIIVVEDEEEAVRRANDSSYGLGATIWTQDRKKGREIASRLEAGTVWINECGRTMNCGEYFQGWKSSGIASSQDRLSMFLRKRTVIHHASATCRDHWFK